MLITILKVQKLILLKHMSKWMCDLFYKCLININDYFIIKLILFLSVCMFPKNNHS